jgi:hypothetical protein
MEKRCHREVVELHRFLESWFNGVLESSDEGFARFAEAMDDGFILISPGGEMSELAPLVAGLRVAHGRWTSAARIRVEKVRLHRLLGEDAAVVTYEEWHEVGDEVRGRLSTAVFGRREGTPNGVVWLHLHEVWLPEV